MWIVCSSGFALSFLSKVSFWARLSEEGRSLRKIRCTPTVEYVMSYVAPESVRTGISEATVHSDRHNIFRANHPSSSIVIVQNERLHAFKIDFYGRHVTA